MHQSFRSIAVPWVIALCVLGCKEDPPLRFETVTLGGREFRLELAITAEQVRKGMMGRTEVGEDEGMLFVFPDEEPRRFWMKGCLVPLDVLFLDRAGRIVSIQTMSVPREDEVDNPPGYPSRWPAQFAIELRAGRATELGLSPGDKVPLPLEKLKRLAR